MPKPELVKEFLKSHLASKLRKKGIADLDDGLSMIESGLIDSFGLLDLVSAVEAKFEIRFELGDADIETLATVGGFVAAVSGATH
jgi:acyl carrier protein